MANIKYVSTREELKAALQDKADYIVVADKRLAHSISAVKTASRAALATAIAAAGVGATMWWNPIGWGASAVAITAGGALVAAVVSLIVILGICLLWALWKDWKVIGKGKITLPGGIVVEGEIILQPN